MGVVRTTFIIDEQGKIMKVMPKVQPDTNAAEVLEILKKKIDVLGYINTLVCVLKNFSFAQKVR